MKYLKERWKLMSLPRSDGLIVRRVNLGSVTLEPKKEWQEARSREMEASKYGHADSRERESLPLYGRDTYD